MIVISSDLSYLLPQLRLYIGDTNSERYTDDWLNVALISAFNALQAWWDFKYLSNIVYSGNTISGFTVQRNPNSRFRVDEPPVLEPQDERAIILYAALLILSGYLEQNAWNFGSWRDNEISVSNIEGGRILREKLRAMWDELNSLYKPPSRRLAGPRRMVLGGYIDNILENPDPKNWSK